MASASSHSFSVVTWNVNSVRSRLEHIQRFCREYRPDILLLQELKVVTEQFPYEAIEDLGYNHAIHGQKTYNGVAILSKTPLEDVITVLPGDETDDAARYIEAVTTIGTQVVRVASIYVPNGQATDSPKFPYKLNFMERLASHARKLLDYGETIILGGDYNIAPSPQDVFDAEKLEGTVCYHPEERKRLFSLLHQGWYDAFRQMNPASNEYSWWDYRAGCWEGNKGYRIDHLLCSPQATDRLHSSEIIKEVRGWEKASDHAPVMASFKLSE